MKCSGLHDINVVLWILIRGDVAGANVLEDRQTCSISKLEPGSNLLFVLNIQVVLENILLRLCHRREDRSLGIRSNDARLEAAIAYVVTK